MNSMNAMNNKYAQQGGKDGSPFNRRRNRTTTIVAAMLAVALVVGVAIWSTGAVIYRNEAQSLLVARVQSECNSALSLSNSLSRTAGTNSSAILGKIRGHVYTMETLSDMYLSLNNKALIPDVTFDALYALIDEYNNKLLTGMMTGDMQSSLVSQLQALQSVVVEIR